MTDNLRFYARNAEPPKEALKSFSGRGGFSGTDISPMWRIKALTETFGPCGFGWRTEASFRIKEFSETDVRIFCDLRLWVRDPETREWSAPIEGYGGNSVVSQRQGRPYVSDECYKMAETDALGSACKKLGIGAKVYWDTDRTKYTLEEDGSVTAEEVSEEEIKAERRQRKAEAADTFLPANRVPKLKDMADAIVQASKSVPGMGIVGRYEAMHGPDITAWSGEAIRACFDEISEADP